MYRKLVALALALMMLLGTVAFAEPAMYSEEYDLLMEQKEIDRWEMYPELEGSETLTITWWSDNQPVNEDVFAVKLANKVFNINLVPILRTGDDALNTLLASGEIPDFMVTGNTSTLLSYYQQGVLASLDEETLRKNMPKYIAGLENSVDMALANVTNTEDGKIMGIPRINIFHAYPIAGSIRADWLKAVGVTEMPKTLADLEKIFYAFAKNDPDGNGKNDTYALSTPASGYGIHNHVFQTVFGAYGINPFYWKEEDGKLNLGMLTKEFVEAMKVLGRWYADGLIDPEFVTDLGRASQYDLAAKFSEGRIGYLDNLGYDDTQWDNDGHLNAKWVAKNESWSKFFKDNIDNADVLYATTNPTTFDDSMIEPYYITMNPVYAEGHEDDYGYVQREVVDSHLAFGAQLNEQPEKLERIMFMLEKMYSDEAAMATFGVGCPGIVWEFKDDGSRVFLNDQAEHAHYHPQAVYTGWTWWICPVFYTNPDMLTVVSGARMDQRFERSAAIVRNMPAIKQALLAPLNAATEEPELMNTRIYEYIVNTIIDNNVEETYDQFVQDWLSDGGAAIIEEANAWYDSVK